MIASSIKEISSKVAKVQFGPSILTAWLTQSSVAYMTSKGLPPGAKLMDLVFDPKTRLATATFTHNDFDTVKEGKMAPELPVEITTLIPPAMVPDGKPH